MSTLLPIRHSFSALLSDELVPNRTKVASLCNQALRSILRAPRWHPFRLQLREISRNQRGLSNEQRSSLLHTLSMDLRPWRTGPVTLDSITIDAEWRSELKWGRIAPLLPPLSGARVADVGCSNGYFLFQLSKLAPDLVVGFDPVDRCFLQYVVTSLFNPTDRISFLPLGLEALPLFSQYYDVILCMGVIYHQRDPLTAVRQLYNAIKPGGILILESLTIPSETEIVLVPRERYAKMRNAWIIPAPKAMEVFLHRAGFKDIAVHEFGPLSVSEQRRTQFAHYESLADFLDPNDLSKTVEGYPAPHLTAVRGVRPA